MRFSKALKLRIVTLEKIEETEEMKEDKKIKKLLGQIDDEDTDNEHIVYEEVTQTVNYYSIDYLVKDENSTNRCVLCSSGHEDVVEISFEELEILIEDHFKEYGIK